MSDLKENHQHRHNNNNNRNRKNKLNSNHRKGHRNKKSKDNKDNHKKWLIGSLREIPIWDQHTISESFKILSTFEKSLSNSLKKSEVLLALDFRNNNNNNNINSLENIENYINNNSNNLIVLKSQKLRKNYFKSSKISPSRLKAPNIKSVDLDKAFREYIILKHLEILSEMNICCNFIQISDCYRSIMLNSDYEDYLSQLPAVRRLSSNNNSQSSQSSQNCQDSQSSQIYSQSEKEDINDIYSQNNNSQCNEINIGINNYKLSVGCTTDEINHHFNGDENDSSTNQHIEDIYNSNDNQQKEENNNSNENLFVDANSIDYDKVTIRIEEFDETTYVYQPQVICISSDEEEEEEEIYTDKEEQNIEENDNEFHFLNFILEFADLGSLQSKEFTLKQWKSVIFQIIYALATSQKHFEFVHNDLHAKNILLKSFPPEKKYLSFHKSNSNGSSSKWFVSEFIVKLTDFGLSRLKTLYGDVIYNERNTGMRAFGTHDIQNLGQLLSKIKISDRSTLTVEDRRSFHDLKKRVVIGSPEPLLYHPFFNSLRNSPDDITTSNCIPFSFEGELPQSQNSTI